MEFWLSVAVSLLRWASVVWAAVALWRIRDRKFLFPFAVACFVGLVGIAALSGDGPRWTSLPEDATFRSLAISGLRLAIVVLVEQAWAERARVVRKLQAQESLQKSLVDDSLGLMCIHEMDGRLVSINRAAAATIGYRPEDGVGRNLADFVDPALKSEFDAYLDRIREHGRDEGFLRLIARDGSKRVWMYRNIVQNEPGRKPYVLGHAQDITELKKAEQKLRQSHEALEARVQERTKDLSEAKAGLEREVAERVKAEKSLRQSEEQLRLVTDALPVCISYVDADLRYRFNNQTYEEWFGLSQADLAGKPIREVLGEKTFAEIRERVEEALRGNSVQYENVILTKTGLKHVLAHFIPYRDGDGRSLGFFSLTTDITDQKRAEEERRKLDARIQHGQKLESLGVMAGGVAHDFNNLLMGILGNAELALLDLPKHSPGREEIRNISQIAHRAAELTKQMLAYSGKGKFTAEPVHLSEVVGEMGRLLEVSISNTVTLKYRLESNLPAIIADPAQIRQVVMNLIINASESIGDEDGIVTIRTGLAQPGAAELTERFLGFLGDESAATKYVYFEVADTGCGMDEETKTRIFEPFFTTKFTGRGLGLAAVLGIVRGHQGGLKLTSEPGKGSTFTVFFPCDESVEPGVATERLQVSRGSGLILVVDDDRPVLDVVSKTLRRDGFNVLAVSDGEQALEVFRQHAQEIRAVVLDLTMPGMDGAEACRLIREIRRDVAMVLSSGYSEQEAAERFGTCIHSWFIQKPYAPHDLLTSLHRITAITN